MLFVAGWEQIPAARLQNPLQKASQKRGGCGILTPMESHFNYQLKMPRCLCREMIKVGVQLASWVEQSGAACCRSLRTKVSFVFRFVLRPPPGALRGHGSSCVLQWILFSILLTLAAKHKITARLLAWLLAASSPASVLRQLVSPQTSVPTHNLLTHLAFLS